MKNKALILLLAIGSLAGCSTNNQKYAEETADIIVYDGCEYVKFGYGQVSWGGHKGNCNNPIHKP